jgi:acetyl-CoA carboxylase biotin carboxyl carrier protein
MDLEQIEALLCLLNDQEVSQFSFEDENLKLKIKLGPVIVQSVVSAVPAAVSVAAVPPGTDSSGVSTPSVEEFHVISSPMVGTFYNAPNPESTPFVKVGDTVEVGQVVCIIEAMKLMNEIESDVDGVVVHIDVDNAQPVQFGQDLIRIRPS